MLPEKIFFKNYILKRFKKFLLDSALTLGSIYKDTTNGWDNCMLSLLILIELSNFLMFFVFISILKNKNLNPSDPRSGLANAQSTSLNNSHLNNFALLVLHE